MKFKLNVMMHGDSIVGVFVEMDEGVYSISIERNHVCFEKNVKLKDLIINTDFFTAEFTEEDLVPKEDLEGVLCYPCSKLTVGRYLKKEIVIEYLDTTNGEIPRHNHPEGVMEVYLSTDSPYQGKICSFGEFHEPFCDHTLAIKIIHKW